MRCLCEDMVERLEELAHIEIDRVAFSFRQARKRTSWGTYASLTPMRFENGSETTVRNGKRYACQKVKDAAGREMLYILSFYLPRFHDQVFREKLVTILHELWHISPEFNGDLRRFPGRCYAHTGSQEKYDQAMEVLAERWLGLDPPRQSYEFLELEFADLQQRYGRVYGTRISHPKMIPLRG